MPQSSPKPDIWVLTIAVVLLVAGLALGGLLLVISLLTIPVLGLGYVLLRPARLGALAKSASAPPRDGADSLWADTESALRLLDCYPPMGGVADEALRLGTVGRRRVEQGRRNPAEPTSVQTRHLLCLAGDALQAFVNAGEPEIERAGVRGLLGEVAQTLEQNRCSNEAEQTLRIRLQVLQRELGQIVKKDQP